MDFGYEPILENPFVLSEMYEGCCGRLLPLQLFFQTKNLLQRGINFCLNDDILEMKSMNSHPFFSYNLQRPKSARVKPVARLSLQHFVLCRIDFSIRVSSWCCTESICPLKLESRFEIVLLLHDAEAKSTRYSREAACGCGYIIVHSWQIEKLS